MSAVTLEEIRSHAKLLQRAEEIAMVISLYSNVTRFEFAENEAKIIFEETDGEKRYFYVSIEAFTCNYDDIRKFTRGVESQPVD